MDAESCLPRSRGGYSSGVERAVSARGILECLGGKLTQDHQRPPQCWSSNSLSSQFETSVPLPSPGGENRTRREAWDGAAVIREGVPALKHDYFVGAVFAECCYFNSPTGQEARLGNGSARTSRQTGEQSAAALRVIYSVIYLFACLLVYLHVVTYHGGCIAWLAVWLLSGVCRLSALSVSNFLTSPFCPRRIVFPAPEETAETAETARKRNKRLLASAPAEEKNSQDITVIYRLQSRVQFSSVTRRRVSHTRPRLPPPFPPSTPLRLPPFHHPPSTTPRPGLTACNGEPHLSRLLLAVGYRQRNRRRPLSRVPPLPSWPFARRLDFTPQTRPVAGTR